MKISKRGLEIFLKKSRNLWNLKISSHISTSKPIKLFQTEIALEFRKSEITSRLYAWLVMWSHKMYSYGSSTLATKCCRATICKFVAVDRLVDIYKIGNKDAPTLLVSFSKFSCCNTTNDCRSRRHNDVFLHRHLDKSFMLSLSRDC